MFYQSGDAPGIPINIRQDGLDLQFELVANPINLTSTLVAYASAVLNHGTIECSASSVKRLTFRIIFGK